MDQSELYVREEKCGTMMKATYMDPSKTDSIKCDIATRKALFMPTYLKHCWTSNDSGTNINFPKFELLLADKIAAYGERAEKRNSKGETDLEDIKFCISELILSEGEMPKDLRALYTSEQLDKVMKILTTDEPGEKWDIMAQKIKATHSN